MCCWWTEISTHCRLWNEFWVTYLNPSIYFWLNFLNASFGLVIAEISTLIPNLQTILGNDEKVTYWLNITSLSKTGLLHNCLKKQVNRCDGVVIGIPWLWRYRLHWHSLDSGDQRESFCLTSTFGLYSSILVVSHKQLVIVTSSPFSRSSMNVNHSQNYSKIYCSA